MSTVQLDDRVEHRAGVSKTALWAGRVISTLVGLFLMFDGVAKVAKVKPVVEGSAPFGIPESTIRGIGLSLVVSTLLYAIPRTSVLGAILLTGYLGGAVFTHVRVDGWAFSALFAVGFGVLVWLGLYLREPRLRDLIPLRSNVSVDGAPV
jgi:hypothetical protein